MARTRHKPSETRCVRVPGGEVQTYSYGNGDDVFLALHGGPAMRSQHIRSTHSWLVDHGFRFVSWDQLGCGESDRPEDASLWTLERFVEEVESVRRSLDLGEVHLYGHSWGGTLCAAYAIQHPHYLESIIIANGIVNVPRHHQEAQRMLAAFGPEFVSMRRRHEYNGTTDSPEYQASETLLRYRHICRMPYWPQEMQDDVDAMNPALFETMFGRSEWNMQFDCVFEDLNLIPAMREVAVPALVLVGEHDELPPDESWEMHRALPNSRFYCFQDASHMIMYEKPEEYDAKLLEFLNSVRG